MPINQNDWQSIYGAIESARSPSEMVVGDVIKRDEDKKFIWMEEFGDRPIPCVALDGYIEVMIPHVSLVDGGHAINTTWTKETCWITWIPPMQGDLAVVIRQFGSRRLPKCLGKVISDGSFEVY